MNTPASDLFRDSRGPSTDAATAQVLPAVEPTTLDRLAVAGIAETVDADGVCRLADYHGSVLLDAVEDLLDYSPKRAATRFGEGNKQRLFGGLLRYQRLFAPDEHWRLIEADHNRATLTWKCISIDIPLVVDVITRTSQLAQLADPSTAPVTRDKVARACNLTAPRESILHFPREARPVKWCTADDPIRMRELAFPHEIRQADAAGTTAFALIDDDRTDGYVGALTGASA